MRASLTLFGMLLIAVAPAPGAEDPPKGAPPPAWQAAAEKAIRAADDAFVRAYNAGDAKAVADLFAEDAEAVDEEGDLARGRPGIADLFATIFEQNPGTKIEIAVESLRFLREGVAVEIGRTKLTSTSGEAPVLNRFTVVFIEKEGRWLQSHVQETPEQNRSAHDRLKELEWLLGEWVDEGSDGVVSTTSRWSDDKNYILRDFTVQVAGRPKATGTQRIGWDPLTKQIKSWVFEAEGGHGEGEWSRVGNQWLIKSTGVLKDGQQVSATHVLTFVNKDLARWKSVDRTIAGRAVPDVDEIVLVRKPPKPR